MLERCYEDVILQNPNTATIMGGTNDFFIGLDNLYVFDNIKLLTKELISKEITPIIFSPPPVISEMATISWSSYTDFRVVNKEPFSLDLALDKYCNENNLTFISVYKMFTNLSCEENTIYIDGVHLTSKGNLLVANRLIDSKIIQP